MFTSDSQHPPRSRHAVHMGAEGYSESTEPIDAVNISFASESLMDPRIQVKLDKYQKCRNIISQTSLLSSYTGSETDAQIQTVDKYRGI